MNQLVNLLVLALLPLVLLLSGYGLAARLTHATATERISVGLLAGLGLLLWNVAAVNLFRPLSGFWAWLCLWPVAVTLLFSASRRAVWHDVRLVLGSRRGATAALGTVAFLGYLLWPLLVNPALVFYDGTSNHDAFFWTIAAEHLMRHSYLELPTPSSVHPLMAAVPAIIGWHPDWGRMAAEGFLALISSLAGTEPVRLYLAATAALFAPWLAAVFLVVRTFVAHRLGVIGTVALVALQPLFVFFHANSNLPNLLGALCAAGAVVATARLLRSEPEPGRAGWFALLALSVHGLLCSYPEMVPFVVFPAGLIWLRAWWATPLRTVWRPATVAALAWVAGVGLNPASSIRSWHGFMASFETARANQNWANLFDPLSPLQYVPALATLSIGGIRFLGWILGAVLTLLLLWGLVLALRRATDRWGACLTLAGAGALLAYTLAFGFSYGWQKTVQFGGAIWAAFFPVAIVDAFARFTAPNVWARRAGLAALGGVLALFAYATIFNCLESHKWSRRKLITEDWFALTTYTRAHLPNAPVLVDGSTFRMAFFHGMWATYFLPDNAPYFAARGFENGGYLRDAVKNEARDPLPPISAFLVSREWAESFDANSPRLFAGDTLALLARSNRVTATTGLFPANGRPDSTFRRVTLDVQPHSPSELLLVLAPRRATDSQISWRIRREAAGEPTFESRVSSAPPWRLVVPLVPGRANSIELVPEPAPAAQPIPPFLVREVRIQDRTP